MLPSQESSHVGNSLTEIAMYHMEQDKNFGIILTMEATNTLGVRFIEIETSRSAYSSRLDNFTHLFCWKTYGRSFPLHYNHDVAMGRIWKDGVEFSGWFY